jgi:extradiol dioxygenase
VTSVHLHSLGYVGVTSPGTDEWDDFGREMFGFEVDSGGPPGSVVRVRWDDRPFRLALHPGPENQISYLGWETATDQDFDAMLARFDESGLRACAATDAELNERGVRRMAWVTDPFGLRHEVFHGPLTFDRSFRGGRPTSRFVTGAKGLGHAVLAVPSHRLALPFYQGVLGLRTSDVVGLGERGTMMFLRCNSRHHSVALWEMNGLLGLQHLMVESAGIDDVGKAYDLVQRSSYDVAATMGRHTGDEQLSFYTRSPSGFDLEFGCDSVEVVEQEWSARYFDVTAGAPNEVWGHHWQALEPQSSLHRYRPAGDAA